MVVLPLKTHAITRKDDDILNIVDKYVTSLSEGSVLAVTSKIVSICEGRMVRTESADKDELIEAEAKLFLPRDANPYHMALTVKNDILSASAGIDESNGDGYYILWPKNPQASANSIRKFLRQKFGLKSVGVIITDSKTQPLRWGTTGIALAHSGFTALHDYIGEPDIFGRKLRVTKANMADALAASAVLLMGEGKEQTPLATISDLPFIEFQGRDPSISELSDLSIDLDSDVYGPILRAAPWQKGQAK